MCLARVLSMTQTSSAPTAPHRCGCTARHCTAVRQANTHGHGLHAVQQYVYERVQCCIEHPPAPVPAPARQVHYMAPVPAGARLVVDAQLLKAGAKFGVIQVGLGGGGWLVWWCSIFF